MRTTSPTAIDVRVVRTTAVTRSPSMSTNSKAHPRCLRQPPRGLSQVQHLNNDGIRSLTVSQASIIPQHREEHRERDQRDHEEDATGDCVSSTRQPRHRGGIGTRQGRPPPNHHAIMDPIRAAGRREKPGWAFSLERVTGIEPTFSAWKLIGRCSPTRGDSAVSAGQQWCCVRSCPAPVHLIPLRRVTLGSRRPGPGCSGPDTQVQFRSEVATIVH